VYLPAGLLGNPSIRFYRISDFNAPTLLLYTVKYSIAIYYLYVCIAAVDTADAILEFILTFLEIFFFSTYTHAPNLNLLQNNILKNIHIFL